MVTHNKRYSNGEITVFWEPPKCIHSTICIRGLSKVFNVNNSPWIDIDAASTEEIIALVDRCPSKALTWAYDKDISNV